MSIEVNCSSCGTIHHANDRLAGRRIRCPHCGAHVEVPVPPTVEVTAADESDDSASDEIIEAVAQVAEVKASSTEPGSHPHAASVATHHVDPSTVVFATDLEEESDLKREKRKEDELDMTPMVDVTFLLLIFFMVTASFSLQKSIESPRQQSDAPSMNNEPEETEELDMVTVQINEFGSFLVLAPDWERETPGKQNLIRALREALGDGNTPMKLAIEVHESTKLQALVDCMDAGTICDYGEVQVTQVDGFD